MIPRWPSGADHRSSCATTSGRRWSWAPNGSPVGSLDRADAEEVVTDVVGGVLLADRAVEESDPELAEAAATGAVPAPSWARGGRRPRRTAPSPPRSLDVVRDPDDFQAVPRLAVTLTGTMDGEPWSSTYHVLVTAEGSLIEREVTAP